MAGLFLCLGFSRGLLWLLGFDLGVPTRPGSGKVFLSTSDTQIVQT